MASIFYDGKSSVDRPNNHNSKFFMCFIYYKNNISKLSNLSFFTLLSMVSFIFLHTHFTAISYTACTFQFTVPHSIAITTLECPLLSENTLAIS